MYTAMVFVSKPGEPNQVHYFPSVGAAELFLDLAKDRDKYKVATMFLDEIAPVQVTLHTGAFHWGHQTTWTHNRDA